MADFKPKTPQQKMFDATIASYKEQIKLGSSIEEAVSQISSMVESNKDLMGVGVTKEDIEYLLTGQRKSEKEFADTVQKIVKEEGRRKPEVSDTEEETLSFTKKVYDSIREGNGFVSKTMSKVTRNFEGVTRGIVGQNKAISAISSFGGVFKNISTGLSDIKNFAGRETSNIVGNSKILDFAGALKSSISDVFTREDSYDKKYMDEMEEQTDILDDINDALTEQSDLQEKQYLASLRAKKTEGYDSGFVKKFLISLGVGALIGGWIRSIFIPVEIAANIVSSTLKAITPNISFFTKNVDEASDSARTVSKVVMDSAKTIKNGAKTVASLLGGSAVILLDKTRWIGGIIDKIGDGFNFFSRLIWSNPITKMFGRYARVIDSNIKVFVTSLQKAGGIFSDIGNMLFEIRGSFVRYLKDVDSAANPIIQFFKGIKQLFGDIRFTLARFNLVSRGVKETSKLIPKVANVLSLFKPFFDGIKSFGKFMPSILSGLKWGLKGGFRILGWPLTFLFGIIDFIKGFRNEQGNFADKLLAGLKSAFLGFIDAPVRIISWVVEKIMGKFGVEMSNTGDKVMSFIGNIPKMITEGFSFLYDSVSQYITKAFDSPLTIVKDFILLPYKVMGWIMNSVLNLLNIKPKDIGVMDMIKSGVTSIISVVMSSFTSVFDEFVKLGKWMFDLPSMLIDIILSKLEKIPGISTLIEADKKVLEGVGKAWGGIKNLFGRSTVNAGANIAGMATGGLTKSSGLAFLHPDEIVGPAKEVIPQIIKEATPTVGLSKEIMPQIIKEAIPTVRSAIDDSSKAKIMLAKKNEESKRTVEYILNKTNENMVKINKEQSNRISGLDTSISKTIVDNSKAVIDPPPDIESLALLFFNKSWGIA